MTSSEKPKDVSTSNGQKKSTVGAKTSTVGPNEIRGHTESRLKAVVKDTPLKAVVKETPLKDVETDTPVKDVEKDTLVKDVEKNGVSVYRKERNQIYLIMSFNAQGVFSFFFLFIFQSLRVVFLVGVFIDITQELRGVPYNHKIKK